MSVLVDNSVLVNSPKINSNIAKNYYKYIQDFDTYESELSLCNNNTYARSSKGMGDIAEIIADIKLINQLQREYDAIKPEDFETREKYEEAKDNAFERLEQAKKNAQDRRNENHNVLIDALCKVLDKIFPHTDKVLSIFDFFNGFKQ